MVDELGEGKILYQIRRSATLQRGRDDAIVYEVDIVQPRPSCLYKTVLDRNELLISLTLLELYGSIVAWQLDSCPLRGTPLGRRSDRQSNGRQSYGRQMSG
ncbi:MAG: hypothetical protein HC781_02445 [Leptolyngbyaceae cyanobacterium CSU_1_4]|nr:hypothetical protein [Leptolyngbyaceae cyanobacterium CSU_1_4]